MVDSLHHFNDKIDYDLHSLFVYAFSHRLPLNIPLAFTSKQISPNENIAFENFKLFRQFPYTFYELEFAKFIYKAISRLKKCFKLKENKREELRVKEVIAIIIIVE